MIYSREMTHISLNVLAIYTEVFTNQTINAKWYSRRRNPVRTICCERRLGMSFYSACQWHDSFSLHVLEALWIHCVFYQKDQSNYWSREICWCMKRSLSGCAIVHCFYLKTTYFIYFTTIKTQVLTTYINHYSWHRCFVFL